MANRSPDCWCDGEAPWCPPCLVGVAVALRIAHPDSLSVGMLRRRIPRISGREAMLLVVATKWIVRNGHRRYVER